MANPDRLRLVLLGGLLGAGTALAAAALPPGWRVSEPDAREQALDAIVGGNLNYWSFLAGWKATPATARAALVQGGLEWTKAFVASPAFAQAYAARRAESKPEPPAAETQSIDQELAADRAKQRKDLEDFRAQIKSMPQDQRQSMADVAKMMEQQQAQMAADPQLQAMLRQGKELERAERKQRYVDAMAQWQQDWPADPKALVAKRLREFLAACDGVAFDAKLRPDPGSGKQVFVDVALEAKPADWKLCYRAGRAPVEAARAFAQAWLKELPAR